MGLFRCGCVTLPSAHPPGRGIWNKPGGFSSISVDVSNKIHLSEVLCSGFDAVVCAFDAPMVAFIRIDVIIMKRLGSFRMSSTVGANSLAMKGPIG